MAPKIRRAILKQLFRGAYWGRRPANFDDIYSCVPKHVPKRGFLKECKKLVKEGLLVMKPGEFGPHFGLNPAKKDEIMEFIRLMKSRK